MGHERLGVLPKTHTWRAIVARLAGAQGSATATAELADLTLRNVRTRFERLADDDAVRAAVRFLVAVPLAARTAAPDAVELGLRKDEQPTPLALARAFQASLDGYPRSERADLAAKALGDALVQFSRDPKFGQAQLFGPSPWDTWRSASSAAGFCELSRLYFAKLTERYLRSFLDREASSVIGDPQRVTEFRQQLRTTVDDISRHAFETSKITQSFAAGWYQRKARLGVPSGNEIRDFLSLAFHKIREELRREAATG